MEVKKYKLGEIADFNKENIGSTDKFTVIEYLDTSSITENVISGISVLNISDAPSRAQRKVTNNTIIYSTVRPRLKHYGILFSPKNNLIVSTGFVTIDVKDIFKDKIDARYLFLLLTQANITEYIGNIADTAVSAYPSINPTDISSIYFNFPDIQIQKIISDIWFNYDSKIELNRAINQNLEAMAKQLYDYWFVQFDFPDENGKPYKSSGGKMVWNEKLKREIPKGWDVKAIGNCTTILLGGTPDTNDSSLWGNGYNWLNSGEVAEFPILTSEKCITQKGLEKSSTVLAPKGSVTLSITRHLRPSILCIDACINQSVVAILENDILTNEYIYPLVNREIPHLMNLRTGAQQPHINKEIVESINVVLPSQGILYAYINKSKNLYKSIFINAQEIADLTKQRDYLLPLLMNGQVSVNSDLSDD